MNEILKLAKEYKLKVIEDCAQAQGSKFRNKFVGTFGDFGCFSFYPTKILGAYGDGGFITTNSLKMLKTIKRLRFYGIEQNNKKNKFNRVYYSNEHGLNSRLDEIHCSILNIKIKQVKDFIKKRRHLADIYNKELLDTSLVLPKENSDNKHVYHLYTVYHPKRERIIKELERKKIKVNIYYPYPIHKMKGYTNKKNINSNLNLTNKMYKGIFSLPLYPELKINDVKKIAKILKQILIKV
jgi:aminotransferase EvaB